MTLFFVLSGFVLWLNYARSFQSSALFVRFARIRRSHDLRDFIRCIPSWCWASSDGLMVRRGISAPSLGFILTMTQAWFPVLDGTLLVAVVPSLEHLWSISVELFFYLLFPFACLLLRGVTAAANDAVARAAQFRRLCGRDLGVLRLRRAAAEGRRSVPDRDAMQWLTYYSPYLHLSQFLAGCIVAMIYEKLASVPIGDREKGGLSQPCSGSRSRAFAIAPVALFLQPRTAGHPIFGSNSACASMKWCPFR